MIAAPDGAGVPPSGSIVYLHGLSDTFAGAGETDAHTTALDADQTLTVALEPTSGEFQSRIEVLDPDGGSLGSATATANGDSVLLQ